MENTAVGRRPSGITKTSGGSESTRTAAVRGEGTAAQRSWPFVLLCVAALALTGWGVMLAMIAAMIPSMDMSALGPGMGIFNAFGPWAGLPDTVLAAISVLCLPSAVNGGLGDWSVAQWGSAFGMWVAMALAMMLPSALPMLKAYHHAQEQKSGQWGAVLASLAVMLGYLVPWIGYAAVATAVQWLFNAKLALMSNVAASMSLSFSASVLLAAGIYQFTPLKRGCLRRCWYPVFAFGPAEEKISDAFAEGFRQGMSCLGCCGAIMGVMFVVGVMNIFWMALLGILMAVEKTFVSKVLPRAIGGFLLLWGGLLVTAIYMQAG